MGFFDFVKNIGKKVWDGVKHVGKRVAEGARWVGSKVSGVTGALKSAAGYIKKIPFVGAIAEKLANMPILGGVSAAQAIDTVDSVANKAKDLSF